MENGKQWFHSDSNGIHLLFESLSLQENNNIWSGYLLIWLICTIERWVSYHLDKTPSTSIATTKRLYIILTRTVLYSLATVMRLLYMLVVMYFNTNLFILVVGSLTMSQLFIENLKQKPHSDGKKYSDLRSGSNENLIIPKIVISDE